MPKFTVKTSFPVDQTPGDDKVVTTKKTEILSDVDVPVAVKLYNSYLTAGYKVSYSLASAEADEEVDPFTLAEKLTKQGVDYVASLKVSTKGDYETMLPAIHAVEGAGFDLNVTVTLKVNDKTTINLDHPDSWDSSDAVYKLSPKAKSVDIDDLKGLYDNLVAKGFDAEITIKPKIDKDAEPAESFAAQLSVYPDGTDLAFNLKQAE